MSFEKHLKELDKNERIERLEKRVAELEGRVQVQPKEKIKPKDDLGDLKHLFAGVKTYPPLS